MMYFRFLWGFRVLCNYRVCLWIPEVDNIWLCTCTINIQILRTNSFLCLMPRCSIFKCLCLINTLFVQTLITMKYLLMSNCYERFIWYIWGGKCTIVLCCGLNIGFQHIILIFRIILKLHIYILAIYLSYTGTCSPIPKCALPALPIHHHPYHHLVHRHPHPHPHLHPHPQVDVLLFIMTRWTTRTR